MFENGKKAARKLRRLMAVAAVPALMALALYLAPHPTDEDASALYILSDDGYVDVDELTEEELEVFLTDDSAELVSRSSGSDLRLTANQAVTITYGDQVLTTTSYQETVSNLLQRMRVYPSPLEMVSVAFGEDTVDIHIASELVFYEHLTSVTEQEVIYEYNWQKPDWYESILQQGQDGLYQETYEVFYQDGVETGRQLIHIQDTEMVPTIIEKGMLSNFANNSDPVSEIVTNDDGSGTITLENGQVLTFSSVRTMTGTAYTAFENPLVDDITATGTLARVGVVAVDRRVLPLGSKVYVVSNDGRFCYGFAIAEDTGVLGNSIDLYMDTYDECIQFGRRNVTVYILD